MSMSEAITASPSGPSFTRIVAIALTAFGLTALFIHKLAGDPTWSELNLRSIC